jgi:peptidoglycan/xylan/chitin deacetylase (PgdA/CDA1 family)
MNAQLPAYYSSLAPFRALFQQATPILTYHKLGPRPGRVRLKGLYVSARLFAAQMAELRAAGFSNGSLLSWDQPPASRVVVTFDDGYLNVLRYGLEPLAAAGLKAIQFLPADLLGKCNQWDVSLGEAAEPIMTASQVREWISAGHEIGSHSLTHPYLTQLPLDRAREEINASRKKLEDLFGVPIQHFCYPYGDWNEPVGELVREAGYKTACTTDPGANQPGDSPFALKRFTARYPSRSLKTFWSWLSRQSIA